MPKAGKNTGRGQVRYGLEKVEELPPDEAGRGMRYHNLLRPLMDDPGSTYCVATFSTDSGAGVVKKELDSGTRPLPPGKWEFEVRRVTEADGNGQSRRVSKLYATYIGPDK